MLLYSPSILIISNSAVLIPKLTFIGTPSVTLSIDILNVSRSSIVLSIRALTSTLKLVWTNIGLEKVTLVLGSISKSLSVDKRKEILIFST